MIILTSEQPTGEEFAGNGKTQILFCMPNNATWTDGLTVVIQRQSPFPTDADGTWYPYMTITGSGPRTVYLVDGTYRLVPSAVGSQAEKQDITENALPRATP